MSSNLSVYVDDTACWYGASRLDKEQKARMVHVGHWAPCQTNYQPFKRAVLEAANDLRALDNKPPLESTAMVAHAYRKGGW